MRTLPFHLLLSGALVLATFFPPSPAAADDTDPLPAGALARFGSARFRGDPDIAGAALSPDGKLLALPAPRSVRLLDTASGKEVRRARAETGGARRGGIRFSPDGKLLAVSHIGNLSVIDVMKGEVVASLVPSGRLSDARLSVSFSGDGKLLAVGGTPLGGPPTGVRDQLSVEVWNVFEKKSLTTVSASRGRWAEATLSSDGKVLATWGYADGQEDDQPAVRLWDLSSGKELHALKIEADQVAGAVFSPDGKLLLVAEGGSGLSLWEVTTGKRLRRLVARRGVGAALAFSPDGKLLISGALDGALQYWDAATGRRVGQCQGPPGALVSLACLGGDKVMAASLSNQAVSLWEGPSGRELSPRGGHDSAVHTLAFARDGKSLLSGGADGVRVWGLATGKQSRRLEGPPPDPMRTRRDGPACQLSPDGRYVVWSDELPTGLRVFEAASSREIAALGVEPYLYGMNVAFAAGGDFLAALGRTATGRGHEVVMRVWDMKTGQEETITPPTGRLGRNVSALSPDGKVLALAAEELGREEASQTLLWDVAANKKLTRVAAGPRVRALTFSPDGTMLATAAADGSIRLWDATTGHELRPLGPERGRYPARLAFSPDGRTLAACGEGDSRVVLWELVSRQVLAEFVGHAGATTAVAFSSDGLTLATGGTDTTVLLWDATGRAELAGDAKAKSTADELPALWSALDSPDAHKAHAAMARLTAAPAEALALFGKELKPAAGKPPTEKETERLIADLDNDSFDVRENASRALGLAGNVVRPALLKAKKEKSGPERKRRLEDLLGALAPKEPPREMIRPTRALEVLERVGTPEARRLLEALAKGNPAAPLTAEATNTLRRLREH
jgi:WD40 repeat protein